MKQPFQYLLLAVRRWFTPENHWLSFRVTPLRTIRATTQNAAARRSSGSFHACLHRVYTFKASLLLAVAVILCMVATALLMCESGQVNSDSNGVLLAIAEILGGVSGILIAIVVFAIQFHGERLGQVSFLLRYLQRHEGLVPIAAVTLAVVGANVLAALIGRLWVPGIVDSMLKLNVLAVPFVLALTLWLFYRMVVSVSSDFFRDGLLPGLIWEYSRAIDREVYASSLREVFESELENAGCEHNPWFGLWRLGNQDGISFCLQRRGVIADINLIELESLVDAVRDSMPGVKVVFAVSPDETVTDAPVMWLVPPDYSVSSTPKPIACPEHVRVAIKRHLDRMFRFQKRSSSDLPEVLARFAEAIVDQMADDRADQSRRGLDVLEELIRLRLARPDAEKVPGTGLHALPNYFGEFKYFEIAKAAVESGDETKIESVLKFAAQLMSVATDAVQPELFHRAGQLINHVYWRATKRKDLIDIVASNVDTWMHAVISPLFYETTNEQGKDRPDLKMDPIRSAAILWALEMIKTTLDANRTQDARDFLDRLQVFRKDLRLKNHRRSIDSDMERIELFAEIVVVGWCVKIIDQQPERCDAACELIQALLADDLHQGKLLRAWELTDHPREGGIIDARHWELMRERLRSGMSRTTTGSTNWVFKGLIAFLLAKYQHSASPRHDGLDSPPKDKPPADTNVRKIAADLLANETIRKSLRIEKSETDKANTSVQELFAKRRKVHNLNELRNTVEASISSQRIDDARTDILDQFNRRRASWLKSVKKSSGECLMSYFPRPKLLRRDWKKLFINAPYSVGNWAERYGDELAAGERITMQFGVEKTSPLLETVKDLPSIPVAVRNAVELLKSEGFCPTMIWIPDHGRFTHALFGVPEWEIPSARSDDRFLIGRWHDIDVFRYPYTNCESIVVLDANAFFGTPSEESSATLEVIVEEPDASKHREMLESAKDEVDESKIPTPNDIFVDLTITLTPNTFVRNVNAACRIDIDLSTLGFAMNTRGTVYHRPDCPTLGKKGIEYSFAQHLENETELRTACKRCRPDDWDDEPTTALT